MRDLRPAAASKNRYLRKLLVVFTIALLVFLSVTVLLNIFGVISLLDYSIYDILTWNNSPPASSKIVVVLIDDKSINGDEQHKGYGRWPWRRSLHATLIKRLLDAGAKVIGFDIYFARKTVQEEDDALIKAIRDAKGRVIIGYDAFSTQQQFLDFALDLPLGDVNPFRGGEGEGHIVRSLYFRTLEKEIRAPYPLSYELVHRALDLKTSPKWDRKSLVTDDTLKIPVEIMKKKGSQAQGSSLEDLNNEPDLRFYISFSSQILDKGREGRKEAKSAYNYVSYIDVMAGNFSPDLFRDKIVLVYSDFNVHDKFQVPGESEMNGGEIHANAVQALLSNQVIIFNKTATGVVFVAMFLTTLLSFLLIKKGVWRGVYIIGMVLLVYRGQEMVYQMWHQWIKVMLPLLAIPLNCFVVYVYEHRKVRGLLARFVPSRVYEILVGSEETMEAGKATEEATILFSDIRGYTTLSEKIGPEELQTFMNEYHKAMVQVVEQFQGEIMYYQGDAQMVAFRSMEKELNCAIRGVAAGLMMQERLAELNDERAKLGSALIQIGVGITTGKVAFGLVGDNRLSYTALGDVVNTAARLQGLSVELSAQVLLDSRTLELAKEVVEVLELESVKLKGKTKSVKAYKLVGWLAPELLKKSTGKKKKQIM